MLSNVSTPYPSSNGTVTSKKLEHQGEITWDDATWILTSSFIIFTMQSGKMLHDYINMIHSLQMIVMDTSKQLFC